MIVPTVVGVESMRWETPSRRDWMSAVDEVRAVRNMKRSNCCAAPRSNCPPLPPLASPSSSVPMGETRQRKALELRAVLTSSPMMPMPEAVEPIYARLLGLCQWVTLGMT